MGYMNFREIDDNKKFRNYNIIFRVFIVFVFILVLILYYLREIRENTSYAEYDVFIIISAAVLFLLSALIKLFVKRMCPGCSSRMERESPSADAGNTSYVYICRKCKLFIDRNITNPD